jgi:hypothetical protein
MMTRYAFSLLAASLLAACGGGGSSTHGGSTGAGGAGGQGVCPDGWTFCNEPVDAGADAPAVDFMPYCSLVSEDPSSCGACGRRCGPGPDLATGDCGVGADDVYCCFSPTIDVPVATCTCAASTCGCSPATCAEHHDPVCGFYPDGCGNMIACNCDGGGSD